MDKKALGKKPEAVKKLEAVKKPEDGKKPEPGNRQNRYSFTQEQRDLVYKLAMWGLPKEHICTLISEGMEIPTLNHHFENELRKGKAIAGSKITETLYNRAINGDNSCLIFWCKTQLGFRETSRFEVTGADGGAIKMEANAGELSDDQLAGIIEKGSKQKNDL